ncbi:uncharacterized protein PG998_006834 [Apiospora kogelbergensis]|uniref:uncharacterized protein n=1 Tax=Apiospora kogelbergensis TaxID=1337665 RepID=UPI00313202FD
MSYGGRSVSSSSGKNRDIGVADVVSEIAAEPNVERVEEAQFWQVHYGLCMANLKLCVARGPTTALWVDYERAFLLWCRIGWAKGILKGREAAVYTVGIGPADIHHAIAISYFCADVNGSVLVSLNRYIVDMSCIETGEPLEGGASHAGAFKKTGIPAVSAVNAAPQPVFWPQQDWHRRRRGCVQTGRVPLLVAPSLRSTHCRPTCLRLAHIWHTPLSRSTWVAGGSSNTDSSVLVFGVYHVTEHVSCFPRMPQGVTGEHGGMASQDPGLALSPQSGGTIFPSVTGLPAADVAGVEVLLQLVLIVSHTGDKTGVQSQILHTIKRTTAAYSNYVHTGIFENSLLWICPLASTPCSICVPCFPDEDSKLRATSLSVRRGGNCPNSLEVLQQLLAQQQQSHKVTPYLISCLPSAEAPATARVRDSFGSDSTVDFTRCIYRRGHDQPASSYIIRSEATGSRTLVNYNDLPEMTLDEFQTAIEGLDPQDDMWVHFEGRIPETTLSCIQYLRQALPKASISVEVEKPGREGLEQLAAEADVVFYSKGWAESNGYQSAHECLMAQSEVARRATVGAGDTFIAGMLYGLLCHQEDWDAETKVRFAVQLATSKVQMEGFSGVGTHVMADGKGVMEQKATAAPPMCSEADNNLRL